MASSKMLPSHSLNGATLDDLMKVPGDRGHVVVGVEVENRTKWDLTRPDAFCERGTIRLPPRDIEPSFREAMVATKTAGVACGTFGTVSWLVNPGNDDQSARRIVVTWSNPFNYDFDKNRLAVGISRKGYSSADRTWTKEMYNDTPNINREGPLRFDRREYSNRSEQVEIEDDTFVVTGMMGTTHDAKVHVVVKEKK